MSLILINITEKYFKQHGLQNEPKTQSEFEKDFEDEMIKIINKYRGDFQAKLPSLDRGSSTEAT